MDSIKSAYFGTIDDRARELVFHYVVFGDRHSDPSNGSSGRAEIGFFPGSDHSIAGNDVVVTLQGRRDPGGVLQVPPSGTTTVARPVGYVQSQTLIHELGHNLGLRHGGSDNNTSSPWTTSSTFNPTVLTAKTNYRSLMNYAYQLNSDPTGNLVRTYSSEAPFDDWGNIKLNFQDSFFFVGNTYGLQRQLGITLKRTRMWSRP